MTCDYCHGTSEKHLRAEHCHPSGIHAAHAFCSACAPIALPGRLGGYTICPMPIGLVREALEDERVEEMRKALAEMFEAYGCAELLDTFVDGAKIKAARAASELL